MTVTAVGPERPALAGTRGRPQYRDAAVAIAIIGLALVLRLIRHSTNYELFVDEITYSNVGLAIASGKGALLYGQPFFLHPPAVMYVLAAAIDIFGKPGTVIGMVMNLRIVNAFIGTLDVALMMLLVRRAVGRRWSAGAGLFVAIDPFLLLFDGRVMLETMAMTASTAGMLAFVVLGERLRSTHRHNGESTAGRWSLRVLACVSGLGFGVALLSKETYVFAGVVPIAVLFLTGWYVPRRWSGAVLATAASCYLLYLASILASGRIGAWWTQQHTGLLRATGVKQISGFNQKGHVSFATRLFATAANYLGTYGIMAIATAAVGWGLWRWWRSGHRGVDLTTSDLMTLWAGSTGLYVAFSALRGAFEQQIFYPFLVAGVPVTLLAVRFWTARRPRRVLRAWPATLLVATIGGILMYDTAVDVRVRVHVDAAYINTVHWVAKHIPPNSLVDVTDGVSQFILHGVRIDTINSLSGVRRAEPAYLIYSSALVNQGYVTLTGGLQQFLRRHGVVLHRAFDRSAIGPLLVYQLPWADTSALSELTR